MCLKEAGEEGLSWVTSVATGRECGDWDWDGWKVKGWRVEAQSLRTPQVTFSVWRKSKGSWGTRREWQQGTEGPQQAGKKKTKRCPGQELSRDSGPGA